MVTGFAAGYYLGARAGRQRYDQINRALGKARRSETVEAAAERAREVLEEGTEKARSLIESRTENGQDEPAADDLAAGGYSSSR
jgi:hypothetical protein